MAKGKAMEREVANIRTGEGALAQEPGGSEATEGRGAEKRSDAIQRILVPEDERTHQHEWEAVEDADPKVRTRAYKCRVCGKVSDIRFLKPSSSSSSST